MPHDLYLKSVIAYVESHIADDMNAKVLSEVVGYDEDYFRRIFKEGTGESIAHYIRRRRLHHAAFDLKNTGRSIATIAVHHGFASHDAFSRAFRKMVGCTPSEFRCSDRAVKGAHITPGYMGPVIIGEENNAMCDQQQKDSVVLYGVPKVSYFNEPPELTPFIASLRACLTYSGQEISYAKLLGGSGAAFRLMWNTKYWDGGNVDILCMRPDPFEPIRRAFDTAGRTHTLLPRSDAKDNKEAMKALIKSELNAGRPVIGFGIIGPPEACVITGYREDGEVLLGWNFFQDFPEWQGGLSFDDCGYFIRRGWYEHSETKAIMAVGDVQEADQDEMVFFTDTLGYALDVMQTERVGDMAGGAKAFDMWRDRLLDEKEFPEDIPLTMLMERLMCQVDAFSMVAEGRAYAGWFFHEEAKKLEQYHDDLLAIAGHFKREHEAVFAMTRYVPFGMGESQAHALCKRENREAIAKIIERCKAMDEEAVAKMQALYNKLKQ